MALSFCTLLCFHVKGSGLHYISTLQLAELITSWRLAFSTCVRVRARRVCTFIVSCVCYSLTEWRTKSYCRINLDTIIELLFSRKMKEKRKKGASGESLMTPGNRLRKTKRLKPWYGCLSAESISLWNEKFAVMPSTIYSVL